jgi:hypothetical protein
MIDRFESTPNEMTLLTPICKVCKNKIDFYECKKFDEIPKKYRLAESHGCPYVLLDKDSPFVEFMRDEKILQQNENLKKQLKD